MIKNDPKVVVDFDDLADLCDSNFLVVMRHVNAHENKITDLVTAMDKLTKRCKRAPKKGLVLFMLAAGIGYVILNEKSKQDMRAQILNLGEEKYGLNEPLNSYEDEGNALEPESI